MHWPDFLFARAGDLHSTQFDRAADARAAFRTIRYGHTRPSRRQFVGDIQKRGLLESLDEYSPVLYQPNENGAFTRYGASLNFDWQGRRYPAASA